MVRPPEHYKHLAELEVVGVARASADARKPTSVGTTLIVVGIVLLGAVGYGVYRLDKKLDEELTLPPRRVEYRRRQR